MASESRNAGRLIFMNFDASDDESMRNTIKSVRFSVDSMSSKKALASIVGFNRVKNTEIKRVGPDWTTPTATTRSELASELTAACGVPPAVLFGGAVATVREGNRQFIGNLQSLSNRLSMVLSDGLAVRVAIDPKPLLQTDLMSRSRAVGSLTGAGVGLSEALQMAGFSERD